MPGQPVSTSTGSGILALGVQNTFTTAWERSRDTSLEGPLGRIVQDAPGSGPGVGDVVKFAYLESPPVVSRWDRSRPIPNKAMRDVGWTVAIDRWAGEIQYRFEDVQDDQTGSIMQMARGVGESFWVRDDANFFQILGASTDVAGLEAVPNAADGSPFFYATDGAGNVRFGVTGGNIVSGQTFTSGAGVRAGFFAALQRRGQFLDTEGQPLFGATGKNWLIFMAAADQQVGMEAFWQPITAQAAATSTSNASVTNVIQAAGLNITLVFTARVSTGVMYCFDTDVPVKPLIRVRRMSPEETVLTRANSNDAQKYGVEGMQWVARTGYGASVPYGAIKVTT